METCPDVEFKPTARRGTLRGLCSSVSAIIRLVLHTNILASILPGALSLSVANPSEDSIKGENHTTLLRAGGVTVWVRNGRGRFR
jgi:hypothetical protein